MNGAHRNTEDAAMDLARAAINEGVQPRQVVAILAQAWDEEIYDMRQRAAESFQRLLRP